MTPGIQQPRTQSSSPSSSFQSSLYRYYSPISSNESTFSRAALQPSTSHNIIQSTADTRRCLKRPQNAKDTSITISPLTKKSKQHAKHLHQPSQPQVQPTPCVRRQVPPSLPRSILERNLTSWRQDLARLSCLLEAKHYFSRPIDMHQVQSQPGQGTFPFAVQCCNTNSLCAVCDENGGVRLLDTSPNQSTGITNEYIRMNCHDNAIFDISWSQDDMRLATASGDQTGKVFDIMSRRCIALFTGYHKTTLKKVVFKPGDTNILTTSSRDGSVYIWDLRCTGISSPDGGAPRYKPTSAILGGHPLSSGRKAGEMVQGAAITGLAWSNDLLVTACDANAIVKVWDPRKISAGSTKVPIPIESSKAPEMHSLRSYGITSIVCNSNRIFALSKDSRIYAFEMGHLDYGTTHTFSHPRLRCDSFWIKLAINDSLLATGSSEAVVLLTSSNPSHWVTGGVVLRGGHTREVSDVSFTYGGGEVCSVSDDMIVRVWRDGSRELRDEGERECGYGWAEW